MRVAADEPVEQALQVSGLRVRDGLRMQPVQAVDGLLAQAEGAVDIALAGALRIGIVGRLVKAEQEVRRRAEIPCDAAHDQSRRHRDLVPVVRLEVLAHGRAADVDLVGQLLRVDGLPVKSIFDECYSCGK